MRRLRLFTLVGALVLVAAACTQAEGEPAALGGDLPGGGVKACLLSNLAGLDDTDLGGYNRKAHEGLEDAERNLGVETTAVEPTSSADFEERIRALMDEGCDLIVTVGRPMGDAIRKVAIQNPDQRFAIVDLTFDPPLENVLALTFATEEAALLAGYLSAGVTRTGKVASGGGRQGRLRVEAFERGVDHHNNEKGTEVQALSAVSEGHNEWELSGYAVRPFFERYIEQDADVLLPPGLELVVSGIAALAEEAGDVSVIWRGATDGCLSDPDHCDRYLASIVKNVDVAVLQAIEAVANGTFEGGTYVGTLENGGVSLLVHDSHNHVPDDLHEEIEALRLAIVAGEITP